jgi:hypothetical protein
MAEVVPRTYKKPVMSDAVIDIKPEVTNNQPGAAAVATVAAAVNDKDQGQSFTIIIYLIGIIVLCMGAYKIYQVLFNNDNAKKVDNSYKKTIENMSPDKLEKLKNLSSVRKIEPPKTPPVETEDDVEKTIEKEKQTIEKENQHIPEEEKKIPVVEDVKLIPVKGQIVAYKRNDTNNETPIKIYDNIKKIIDDYEGAKEEELVNSIKNNTPYLDMRFIIA